MRDGLNDDLEDLRSLVGRPVELRSGEEARIVRHAQGLHERRGELLRREAAERAVLRGDDDVEPAHRRGDVRGASQYLMSVLV